MSKYTTEVRYICESLYTKQDGDTPLTMVQNAYAKVFNADTIALYEGIGHDDIFRKILIHYFTREIAHETYGLWRLNINRLLVEKFPEYKELYRTVDEKYSMLDDVGYTREFDGTSSAKSESENTNKSKSVNKDVQKYSETPQGGLDGVESGKYLTTANINDGTGNSESTGNGKSATAGTNKSKETIKGKQGGKSYAAMVREYRAAIYNVDMRIIDDCATMFFNLW